VFGEIHPRMLGLLDIEGPLIGFEIYLDNLPQPKARRPVQGRAQRFSDLMPVRRDFAFVVDKATPGRNAVESSQRRGEGPDCRRHPVRRL
jgi:phenylalanyl-tRNA synthetase beta chain